MRGRLHQLSRRRVWAGLAAVSALCASSALSANRDLKVPFVAATSFSPQAFAGDWYEVARFLANAGDRPPQAKLRYEFDRKSGHLKKSIIGISGIDPVLFKPSKGMAFEEFKPGQLRLVGKRFSPVIWVLWVDKAYQTAVLAEKSGAHTVILDRNPLIAPDRLASAVRVLRRYGYDPSKLRLIGP